MLVSVTVAEFVVPTFTFPKFKPEDGFRVSSPGAALTERMAGLLVTLPAALLTTTLNKVPSTVLAGEIKVEDVAPEMAVPFCSH